MKENHKSVLCCTLRNTAMSLVISFWVAAGFVCFFEWFTIVNFHGMSGMSEYPIAYPASIVGGFVALTAFMLSVFFYVKMRKGDWRIKGVLLDAVVAYLSFPIFFFWLMLCVYPWLERLV